jgi:hypothetical protein
MTPAQMCVLFSADIIAFFLIWLTNFSERGPDERKTAAWQKALHAEHAVADEGLKCQHDGGRVDVWNVGSFLSFKS